MAIDRRRFPTTFLTLVGFRYIDGGHPGDVISEHVLDSDRNPHLLYRVRGTARHVARRIARTGRAEVPNGRREY